MEENNFSLISFFLAMTSNVDFHFDYSIWCFWLTSAVKLDTGVNEKTR